MLKEEEKSAKIRSVLSVSILIFVWRVEWIKMKEITVLNRISKLVENIDYRSLYIEIKTNNDKYIIEKEKPRTMEFRKE